MTKLNADFRDILDEFKKHGVDHVVVGAYALAAAGVPRATGDIDILVRATQDNAKRVMAALAAFGAPLNAAQVTEADFSRTGMVYQMGQVPRRIDILTSISGVDFDEAYDHRKLVALDGVDIPALAPEQLIKNKRAAGRPKDLADVDALERLARSRPR